MYTCKNNQNKIIKKYQNKRNMVDIKITLKYISNIKVWKDINKYAIKSTDSKTAG